MPYSLIILLALSSLSLSAHSQEQQSTIELMCRNQAKEIAAETYKNCVTENKQQQIEQIRKEYQAKLSDLKNHYDQELKKISPKKTSTSTKKDTPTKKITSKVKTSSTLPEKTTLKKEVIDFTEPTDSTGTLKTTATTQGSDEDVEIVEIPIE